MCCYKVPGGPNVSPSVCRGVKYHQNVPNVHRYIRNYVGGKSTYVHAYLSFQPLSLPSQMYCVWRSHQ